MLRSVLFSLYASTCKTTRLHVRCIVCKMLHTTHFCVVQVPHMWTHVRYTYYLQNNRFFTCYVNECIYIQNVKSTREGTH